MTTKTTGRQKNGIYRRLLAALQSLKVYSFSHQNWDEWSVIGWQPGWGTVLCSAYGWSVEFSAKLVSVVTSKAFKLITRWAIKNGFLHSSSLLMSGSLLRRWQILFNQIHNVNNFECTMWKQNPREQPTCFVYDLSGKHYFLYVSLKKIYFLRW